MHGLKGKVILITGGTAGIGRCSAQYFGKLGAKVVVSGRRLEEGQKTVALTKEAGGEAIFVHCDVSKENEVETLVKETVARFGRIDCAFNNAGIEGGIVPMAEQSEDNYRSVYDINVLGVLLAMKYEIMQMRRQGTGGAIVNNASVAGMIGMAGGAVYFGSKHSVIGMTKCAALETAKENIRINSVSPAGIETEMYSRFVGDDPEAVRKFAALHPMRRIGQPLEVAAPVAFLFSEGASFITGANLAIDGGFTAQ